MNCCLGTSSVSLVMLSASGLRSLENWVSGDLNIGAWGIKKTFNASNNVPLDPLVFYGLCNSLEMLLWYLQRFGSGTSRRQGFLQDIAFEQHAFACFVDMSWIFWSSLLLYWQYSNTLEFEPFIFEVWCETKTRSHDLNRAKVLHQCRKDEYCFYPLYICMYIYIWLMP